FLQAENAISNEALRVLLFGVLDHPSRGAQQVRIVHALGDALRLVEHRAEALDIDILQLDLYGQAHERSPFLSRYSVLDRGGGSTAIIARSRRPCEDVRSAGSREQPRFSTG